MARKSILTQFLRDESGATAVEYGLILALVVLAMLTALNGFASVAIEMWNNVSTKTSTAINGG